MLRREKVFRIIIRRSELHYSRFDGSIQAAKQSKRNLKPKGSRFVSITKKQQEVD